MRKSKFFGLLMYDQQSSVFALYLGSNFALGLVMIGSDNYKIFFFSLQR